MTYCVLDFDKINYAGMTGHTFGGISIEHNASLIGSDYQ